MWAIFQSVSKAFFSGARRYHYRWRSLHANMKAWRKLKFINALHCVRLFFFIVEEIICNCFDKSSSSRVQNILKNFKKQLFTYIRNKLLGLVISFLPQRILTVWLSLRPDVLLKLLGWALALMNGSKTYLNQQLQCSLDKNQKTDFLGHSEWSWFVFKRYFYDVIRSLNSFFLVIF